MCSVEQRLIRPAVPEDAAAVACVHVDSWQAAYRGLLPDEYLDSLRWEDRAARYDFTHANPRMAHTLVAEMGGRICGFASTMPARDADLPGCGELCALYVAPAAWGKGIGVALIEAARAFLADQGYPLASLWLLKGNLRGERFYRRDGWTLDGAHKVDRCWDAEVEEYRYVRRLP